MDTVIEDKNSNKPLRWNFFLNENKFPEAVNGDL